MSLRPRYRGFSSCTDSEEVAKSFMQASKGKGTLFRIHALNSINISEVSFYNHEREHLLTAGTRLEVVSRKMFTVTGEKPDTDAVERMIESGESEAIFQKATLTSGRGHIMSVLEDVVEQKDAILQLETKLVELQQIFMDLAVLVEAQGETLDNIETQVAKTVDFVNSGTSALVDAKTYQQRSRKTMCCVIVILLSIILVIVVGVLKPWESGQA